MLRIHGRHDRTHADLHEVAGGRAESGRRAVTDQEDRCGVDDMATWWRHCSAWAVRMLQSRGTAPDCAPWYRGQAHGGGREPFGGGLGVRPGWLGAGHRSFHRYSSAAAAAEVDLDGDADVDALPVYSEATFTEADRERSFGFLRTLGLKEERVARLVKKYPLVMSHSFKDGMVSLARTLSTVGISEQLASRILEKNPGLVFRILERNLYSGNLAYLQACGLTAKQLERVVRIYPQSLGASKKLQLEPTVEFLLNLGVTEEKLGKVLSLSPYYLGYRHEISLQPKVAFLLGLGVKRENLGKLIMEQPSILCLSMGENIIPKLKYLESVGVERGRLGEMICRYPAMLTANLDTMKLKVDFFGSKGLNGKNLVSLLTLHPDLLGRSLDSLNLGFVNVQNIGFTQEEVCSILKMHPTVLSSTETHLRKKFEFLTTVMNRSLKEVLTFTAFVTYSLERRIKPRHRVFTWLLDEGLLPQKNYSLRTIIGGSEEYFRDRYLVLHPSAEAMYKEPLEVKAG